MSNEDQKVSVLLEVTCVLERLPCLGIKKSSRTEKQYLEWCVFYSYCPSKWQISLSFLRERKKQKSEELMVATFFCKILWLSTFLYWGYSILEYLCCSLCVTLSMSLRSRDEFFLKFYKGKLRLALAHARGNFQGQELEKYTQKLLSSATEILIFLSASEERWIGSLCLNLLQLLSLMWGEQKWTQNCPQQNLLESYSTRIAFALRLMLHWLS